jgi:predicted enzyme related to lactoylglutathione lyase
MSSNKLKMLWRMYSVNLGRAILFYSAVFDCALERVQIDGNAIARFPASGHSGGITGALAQGESYIPGKQGVRVSFATARLTSLLDKAVHAGGTGCYANASRRPLRGNPCPKYHKITQRKPSAFNQNSVATR